MLAARAGLSPARDLVPYPPACTVQPADGFNGVVIGPSSPAPIPASVEDIVIQGQGNVPIADASVYVYFGNGIRLCPGAVYSGATDSQGHLRLALNGGGCISGLDQACIIRANGIVVRDYQNVKSPDFDGVSGDGRMNLGDLVEFVRESNSHGVCHDYDNSGSYSLLEFTIFASAFTPAHHCP